MLILCICFTKAQCLQKILLLQRLASKTRLRSLLGVSRAGLALNAVRVFENAKSVRKCVRFGLACVRLHGSVRFVFMFVFGVRFVFMFVCGVRVHVRGPILRKSTNSTLGKRASF